jgi:hypothetical protein
MRLLRSQGGSAGSNPVGATGKTAAVDILSRLNGKGPADARAFAGIAYWIANDGDRGNEPKAAAAAGPVGLFVDIGTEAYFPNLRIKPAE